MRIRRSSRSPRRRRCAAACRAAIARACSSRTRRAGSGSSVMLEERRIDLKRLAARLAAPRFSFGSAADLYQAARGAAGQRDAVRARQRCRAARHAGARRRHAGARPAQLSSAAKTTARPRSRPPICCASSPLRGHAPRIVELDDLDASRPRHGLSRLDRTARLSERLSSRRPAAMFRDKPGEKSDAE